MLDQPDNLNGDEKDDLLPSRRLGAFEFMADHLYDLVLVIRTTTDDLLHLRRVELYYAERGMVSSFVFDRSAKKFRNDPARAIPAAMDQLMTEVKSRALSHNEFVVWYYSEADRDLVESYAKAHVQDHKTQLKHFKQLIGNSQIISDVLEPSEPE